MSTSSYKHLDGAAEQNRLVQQFQRDWPWEQKALGNLGIVPNLPSISAALSCGCGVGIDAATLSVEGYAEYVEGWDGSEEMVEYATKQYGNDNLVFRCVDLTDGPSILTARKFDLIFCRLMFLHNKKESVPRLLKNCVDLLNEGGFLVVDDVNKTRESVTPSAHEFGVIVKQIRDYLVHCGNNPQIGALMPQLFSEVGLRDIRFQVIEQNRNFEETKTDLAYCLNVSDDAKPDGRLVSQGLWEKACNNRVLHFKRKTLRVISVGQK